MKTAAVYARYSCERQNEQSIDGQIHVCQDFAERNDIKIVKTYIDKAMSGTNDNRKAFQRMLKDSDKKEWDYVLIYKLDRFSRNKYEMAIHRKHLKDNGIKILSAMENIPDSPEGILLESLLEGMNQYYSEELSQKTKRGMNETRLKGNFIGGIVNYGYSLKPVYSDVNGKQVVTAQKVIINEQEAPIVREIFEEYANGKLPVDIARALCGRGIKRRSNQFQAQSVYHILRQEKYTGVYRIHGMTFDNIYPAIVPHEVFEVVKTRIEANQYGKHPTSDVNYLLKGKIYCGYCGRRMTSFTGTSKSGIVSRYYKCHKISPCKQSKTIRKEPLEQAISSALKNSLSSEENFSYLLDKIIGLNNDTLHNNTELKITEKELSAVEKSLSNLLNAIEAGMLTETTKERLLELESRKRELKSRILTEKTKEVKPPDKDEIAQYLLYALSQPTKAMIDLLIDKVLITDESVILYLKYTTDTPPNKSKRGRPKKNENPERILSEQGFLFNYYTFSYLVNIGRPNIVKSQPHKTQTKFIKVQIYI